MASRNYVVIDELSDLITCGGVPTVSHVREKFGLGIGEKAFWAMFAPFYGFKRDSGLPYSRHPYDTVIRSVARGVYNVRPLETWSGLNHDSPEDIWKAVSWAAREDEEANTVRSVRPIVASYVMLDILASIVDPIVAYGLPYNENGAQKRYGGVIDLTDFHDLISDPVLKSQAFHLKRNKPRFERVKRDGIELAVLTDFGRDHFISSLHKTYDGFSVSREEVVKAYQFIREMYGRFVEVHLNDPSLAEKGLELDERQKEDIRQIVNQFIFAIDQKFGQGDIVSLSSLEESVRREFGSVLAVFGDDADLRPADLSLVPSQKSPYTTTIRKTLYGAHLSRLVSETMEVVSAFKAGTFQYGDDVITSLMVKIMDNTDNISNMGPMLEDMTSQHRKSRLLISEFAPAVTTLYSMGIPTQHPIRLYQGIEYLLAILRERIKHWHDGSKNLAQGRKTGETSYREAAVKLGIMLERIGELEKILKDNRTSGLGYDTSLFRRISSFVI